MGSEWKEYLLEEICDELTVGYVGSMASEYISNGVTFLRSQNVIPFNLDYSDVKYISAEFNSKIKKSQLNPGDVVIVRTGKPGACAVIPDNAPPMNCSDLVIIRTGKELLPDYLMYYINTIASHHINAHLVGAVQQHFNVGSAKKIKIPLPPLQEQSKIVSILKTIDDKIRLNTQMNHTLEAMARALFKSWFVDFDPVKANAEGRRMEGILPEVQALFPSEFEDSPLGLVPLGWEISTLASLGKISKEGMKPENFQDQMVHHYSIPAFDSQKMPVLENGSGIKSNKFLVKENSILVSKLNPETPRVWLTKINYQHISLASTEFIVLLSDHSDQRMFLYQYLCSDIFTQSFASKVTGTSKSHQRANPNDLLATEFIKPSPEIVSAFATAVSSIHEKVQINRIEIEVLAKTRDSLLPKLLSGELDVSQLSNLVSTD
ncbi:restriction endonuclease subunit S [Deinococcus cellulosilyticus]|uniref:Type I restriction modification DNA specificity domain-containing protein n=1 Tax=Deinococcus cellulosilyticus (strain DSM 18568 / NBRC 106333 / KACC 11606 / 5516J-15) TaxID=1223518 RepID=A0A511N9X2_DEIC1|nr:restriction endonuclease subunit S [Deinococcus cellulosilyticus]GEM49625.1 hypothetical protein DC3_52600 [Deinococcus cellulosilyticus NBRC 106333 = KACC 11606]